MKFHPSRFLIVNQKKISMNESYKSYKKKKNLVTWRMIITSFLLTLRAWLKQEYSLDSLTVVMCKCVMCSSVKFIGTEKRKKFFEKRFLRERERERGMDS